MSRCFECGRGEADTKIVVDIPRWCPSREDLEIARASVRSIAKALHDSEGMIPAKLRAALLMVAQDAFAALGGAGVIPSDPLDLDDDGGEQEAEDASRAEHDDRKARSE